VRGVMDEILGDLEGDVVLGFASIGQEDLELWG
jgi:hypothetical protein